MIDGAEMPSSCLQENGESERESESQIASEEPEFTTENGEATAKKHIVSYIKM